MARRLSTEERRTQLISVGRRVFSARPFDEVSTDDIAAEAGISKGLLYHYFGSKRGFYVAVVSDLADQLLDATRLDPEAPLDGAVHRALEAFHGFVTEHGLLYRTLMRGGIGSDPEVESVVEGVRQTILRRVLARFDLGEPPPQLRARLYGWVGAIEAVGLDTVTHGDIDRETFVAILVQALLGMLPDDVV